MSKKQRIDHGAIFVPHSTESSRHLAPSTLDSYKRSYNERSTQRRRDNDALNYPDKYSERRPASNLLNNFVERICSGGRGKNKVNVSEELDQLKSNTPSAFKSGKSMTFVLSQLARRRNIRVAMEVWRWMEHTKFERSVFHFNALISVCEKCRDWRRAVNILQQMDDEGIQRNMITFSSAISACEKSGCYQVAIDLLDQMEKECESKSVVPYNAAISACEKGMDNTKALQVFDRMKKRGIEPTAVTYSALISSCEKCGMWKLALNILEEMKRDFGTNVIAYSAAIAALSKGQQWELALRLFRELQETGASPSVVTYNTTMTCLEKGLQWEKALDLFDEMKYNNLPITVVSYGSAISACEKGHQWKQCLDYLDEMTERDIDKNVIIFGAAMSCMEKCRRADIAFQLMERMELEGVKPNVHIYNCAITACARCNLPDKGRQIFMDMERDGIKRDIVSYNAILDVLSTNVPLAREIFQEGVKIGFYSKVSRLGEHWLELDLHFLSLGGGEIAMWWWFEECLVPYLCSNTKLEKVKAINIVTGYGKSRKREATHEGMRKRVLAMMHFMNLKEIRQSNMGRIQLDISAFIQEVRKNSGKIKFDADGYRSYVQEEARANEYVEVEQVRRPKMGSPKRNDDFGDGRHVIDQSDSGSASERGEGYGQDTRSYPDNGHNHRGRIHGRGRGRGRGRGNLDRGGQSGGRAYSGRGRGDESGQNASGHYGPAHSSSRRKRSPSYSDDAGYQNGRYGDGGFRHRDERSRGRFRGRGRGGRGYR